MTHNHSPIRLFPDHVLRKPSTEVKVFDQHLRQTVHTMISVMRSQTKGIGIAAPQIGISLRIAIVDVSERVPGAELMVLINPCIKESSGETLSREGCMSLPEYTAYLKRSTQILVSWQDLSGNYLEKRTSGIEAICIQHEVDHLNGMLFIDRVVSLKTDMMPRMKYKKTGK